MICEGGYGGAVYCLVIGHTGSCTLECMVSPIAAFQALHRAQRRAFTACFLGWTLDAFDFFLLTYTLDSVAKTFGVDLKTAATAIFWTLCMRPVGALLFGAMAERYGRRPTLMVNIVCFSVFELMSAFAPTFRSFLVLRALFGVAMGGEWGVGAALALETLPAENRGFFAGLLQEGYAAGNLLAAAAYGLLAIFYHGRAFAAWRVLFLLGALPSLLVFYVRAGVEESPALDGWPDCHGGTTAGWRAFAGAAAVCWETPAGVLPAGGADDRANVAEPWNAGFVSDISEDGSPALAAGGFGGGDRGYAGGAGGWADVGSDLRAMGQAAGAGVLGAAGDPGNSVVDLEPFRCHAGLGWVSDAVHGAGRVGHCAGAPE